MKHSYFLAVTIGTALILTACGSSPKKTKILTSQANQETQVIVNQDGAPVLLTEIDKEDQHEGYTIYTVTEMVEPTQETPPSATVEEPATAVKPEQPKTPQPKEEQPKPAQEEKNLIIDKEGRLTHPWVLAKEVSLKDGEKAPVWFGEDLKFKIGWSFITAGEAEIQTGRLVEADGKRMFEIKTTAKSYSVIDTMFKVRDINTSWLAFDMSKSYGYWQSVREGRYSRDEWIVFDYQAKKFKAHKKNRRDELSYSETDLKKENVFDMLTALYYVRTQPLPEKGEVYFDIVNAGKEYPLKVVVHGKETVKVKAGKFKCILVEPEINGEGIFVSKGKSLKVWLTDDEYKMPVKMSVEVFIGSVKAELAEYSR